ncbi:MAG: glycosyltransferase, partial [Caldilineaceae bacterium]|nr:glycosyltransferase [Caldilineaceae bacterium]
MGSVNGLEKGLVERAGLTFRGVDTGQLRGINPLTALANTGKMIRGVGQALTILKEFRPDVCFVTGGYVCAPMAVACKLRRVPLLIYLPDMVPGLAIKWLSRLAQKVAVSFPDAAAYFPGKAVVTGYPVRGDLVQAAQDRRGSRQKLAAALKLDLGLDEAETPPLLLVWGGSQGSRSINKAIQASLADLLPVAHILHLTGTLDYDRVVGGLADLPTAWQNRYHPVAYLHAEMPLALAAADVSVCRAGASTLGELPVARQTLTSAAARA